MTTQLINDLRAARALVEHGWCQGAAGKAKDGDVRMPWEPDVAFYCAGGAIERATRDTPRFSGVFEFFCRTIRRKETARWNDAPGRTQADVIAAFDRAIALAAPSK